MNILCICHANICRSFMAQEFLKQLLPGETVFSRGIYADPSYQVPSKVKEALAAHRIVFQSHTATPLHPQDLQQADLIFCMEKAHRVDGFFEILQGSLCKIINSPILLKELPCHHIYPFIGTLGGQYGGNQELVGFFIFQRRFRE